MPLTEQEKNYIIEKAVEIIQDPDSKNKLEELKQSVLQKSENNDKSEEGVDLDEVIYSVIQAIQEIYPLQQKKNE